MGLNPTLPPRQRCTAEGRLIVMLPRRDLLEGARDPEALEALIQQAEVVLRTYQPSWSAFLTGPQREEAEARLAPLEELHPAGTREQRATQSGRFHQGNHHEGEPGSPLVS